MSTQDIVQKLWNLCNVLRDDGITYHQYVTELTYILFLKMLNETGEEERLISSVREAYAKKLEAYAKKQKKPVEALDEKEKEDLKGALYAYSWDYFASLEGLELKKYYNKLLSELGEASFNKISEIYGKGLIPNELLLE